MKVSRLLTIASLIALSACQTLALSENAVKLDVESLESVFSNKTAYAKFDAGYSKGVTVAEYYAANGKLGYQNLSGTKKGFKAYGIWRIKGEDFCTRYITETNDDEYCWAVYEDGSNYIFIATNDPQNRGKITQVRIYSIKNGDVEGLLVE